MSRESENYKNGFIDEMMKKGKMLLDAMKSGECADEAFLNEIRFLLEKAYNVGSDAGWGEGYQEAINEVSENE